MNTIAATEAKSHLRRVKVSTLVLLLPAFTVHGEVQIAADFTNKDHQRQDLHDMWNVVNRRKLDAERGALDLREGDLRLNLIRIIGGATTTWTGDMDGAKKDFDYDPILWDEEKKKYIYHMDRLKARFDRIIHGDKRPIHQVAIDKPPWAFQRGYTFIPEGKNDGQHFRKNEEISEYGNALPPSDPEKYYKFIQEVMKLLMKEYPNLYKTWRYRIHTEVESHGHWAGTEKEFVEYYANTVRAIRSVYPEAKVGLHTHKATFGQNGKARINYKGEAVASYADALIEYCHENPDVMYDFWGISHYNELNMPGQRKLDWFDEYFGPFVNHPKWNPRTILSVDEASVIVSMQPFSHCTTSHREAYNVGISKLLYERYDTGFRHVHMEDNRKGDEPWPAPDIVSTMIGKTRWQSRSSGKPLIEGNLIDALVAREKSNERFDVLIYNYNEISLEYQNHEPVTVALTTPAPAGTRMRYRKMVYGKDQNAFQTFLLKEPASGWIKQGWDRNGDPRRILNEDGEAAWKTFTNPNPRKWTPWMEVITLARNDGGEGSVAAIKTELPSFAFEKIEVVVKGTLRLEVK